ncbi:PREDICTED: ejaculatory bulb-specific protein 3-like [Papilio xuthus]|uniref:Ejaculatory bulb-specific protein 3-like n=1 Tax=Papilio xuthus TaxID=66420 RepID=A0AAJ6Z0P0_PAPXU|nr:PREDICTED: ejaculatory bulb-specific protein 3-like [Papilio xuthus]
MTFKVFILCVVATSFAAQYTDKYDDINLKEIVENKRILLSYANCVLEKGKCSPEGKVLKDHIKDAIETGCKKCTDAQRTGTETMIRHLIKYEPDIWNELATKYDSTGEWRKTYEDEARKYGIL